MIKILVIAFKKKLIEFDEYFPFLFKVLKYFNINFYLAYYYSLRFKFFYLKSRKLYEQETAKKTSFNINQFKVKIYDPVKQSNDFNLPDDYLNLVKKIAIEVDDQFKESSNCYFYPKLKHPKQKLIKDLEDTKLKNISSLQLKDPFCIENLEQVCKYVLEELEKEFWGSYLFLDKVYIYRTLVTENKDKGSFQWHFDNHPNTLSKVMIYLTDVSKKNGAMSVYKSGDGDFYKFKSLPGLQKPFYHSRINKQRIEKITKNNIFAPFYLEGSQGTAVHFSENILHKANAPQEKFRDVIVIQLKPSVSKMTLLNKELTGTFNHEDVLNSPSIIAQRLKRKMASG